MKSSLLIVVPSFNEEEALPGSVRELLSVDMGVAFDVLIVNDGSTDRTQQVSENLRRENARIKVVNLPLNGGIGAAVQTGFLYALRNGYRAAVQYDADGQHDPAYLPKLFQAAEEQDLDLCIGSRFLSPLSDSFRSTPLRRMGIRFFSHLISILCGVRVTDPTSGFRIYRHRAIQLFSRYYPDDYPEPEAVFLCAHNGLSVGETSVSMRARQGGMSSIRYFRSGYYMLKVTIAILVDRIRRREKKKI